MKMSIEQKEEYANGILWDVYGEIKEILGEDKMPEYMDFEGVKYNSRLRRVIARCHFRKMTYGPPAYHFEISDVFYSLNYDIQVNVLAHEWIHAILAYNGIFDESHGTYFKRIMNILNNSGDFNISIHIEDSDFEQSGIDSRPGAKYILKCQKCGQKWEYYRMCKTVQRYGKYIHTGCGGHLERMK